MELQKINKSDYGISDFLTNIQSEQTRRAYSRDISDFFQFLKENGIIIGTPNELTIQLFISYRDHLLRTKAPTTVGRKLACLKSLMKWFHVNGHIQNNPTASLKLPKATPKKPTEAFTDAEVRELLELAGENKTHKAILYLLFYVGLRRSEVVDITKSDIKTQYDISILRVKGKGDKVREVPLKPEIVALLDSVKSHKLFSITPDGIYKMLKRYCDRLGIKNKSPHSCRATLVSHLLEKDVSVRNVADFVGHSSINTTMIYDKKRRGIKDSPAKEVDYEDAA